MIKKALALLLALTSCAFAQTEYDFWEFEEPPPMDVVPLSDEEAARLTVPLVQVRPIPVQVPVVELADVLLASAPGLSVATVELIIRSVQAMDVRTVTAEAACIVAKAVELAQADPVAPEAVASIEAVRIVLAALEAAGCRALSPGVVALALRQIAAGSVRTHSVPLAEIEPADRRIPEIQAFWRRCAELFADQRMLAHDRGLDFDSPAVAKWLDIYQRPLPPPIEAVPMPQGIRMIAELRLMPDGSLPPAAAANLGYYRSQGYTSCLITLSGLDLLASATARSRLPELRRLLALVRQAGLSPWLAWAGPESLYETIYHDPDQLRALLASLAPLADGYLCAWRRTSAHLVQQDPHYIEHLAAVVRRANPGLPVVGESYYGQTWQNLPHVRQDGWEARDNSPRSASGVLIAGISTRGYAIETMLRTTFAHWSAYPRLALVLGDRPYYASSGSNGLDFGTNLRLKQQLEQRFLAAGCVGTITIHGDGSDRGSTLMTTDNLGAYPIIP